MSTITKADIRELDQRTGDGLEVTLLWKSATNQVVVAVRDERRDASIEIDVDSAHARDAFLHPFAYAGSKRHARASTLPRARLVRPMERPVEERKPRRE